MIPKTIEPEGGMGLQRGTDKEGISHNALRTATGTSCASTSTTVRGTGKTAGSIAIGTSTTRRPCSEIPSFLSRLPSGKFGGVLFCKLTVPAAKLSTDSIYRDRECIIFLECRLFGLSNGHKAVFLDVAKSLRLQEF